MPKTKVSTKPTIAKHNHDDGVGNAKQYRLHRVKAHELVLFLDNEKDHAHDPDVGERSRDRSDPCRLKENCSEVDCSGRAWLTGRADFA